MINVALPKGRLGDKVYEKLAAAGYECPELLDKKSRRLVFENKAKGVRYFSVKPTDVAVYVERGAADVGIAGKDILLEYAPDFYDDTDRPLRVATKFPTIARAYYEGKGRDIDIIKLHGSIELAPILELSDVICDIVETGSTLKENNLVVLEEVEPISARFIANRISWQFKHEEIMAMKHALEAQMEETR